MALAIILTDTHLSPNNIELNISIYKQVIEKAKELKLKNVFHAGDIFDSRKAQPLDTLIAFENILSLFSDADINLIAIPGNHDKNNYRSEESYLDPFKHHPNFTLIQNFDIIELSKNVDIALIPFFAESDTYSAYLNELDSFIKIEKKTILLTHIAVSGVKNNDGSKVENNISEDLFSKFDKVLIGHYHNYSQVGYKVFYIGSAFQHNFGEDSKKGFTVINEDCSIELIQSKFPEFKKVIIDLNTYSPKEAEDLIKEYDVENDKIRVVFKGTYAQINSIDKNKFKKNGVDVKLEASEIQVSIDEASEDKFVSFDKKAIKNEFDEFCEINEIKNSEIGKEYLTQFLN